MGETELKDKVDRIAATHEQELEEQVWRLRKEYDVKAKSAEEEIALKRELLESEHQRLTELEKEVQLKLTELQKEKADLTVSNAVETSKRIESTVSKIGASVSCQTELMLFNDLLRESKANNQKPPKMSKTEISSKMYDDADENSGPENDDSP